jgi:hypothetical protein
MIEAATEGKILEGGFGWGGLFLVEQFAMDDPSDEIFESIIGIVELFDVFSDKSGFIVG